MITFYTDGACMNGSGGEGGWGFVCVENDRVWKVSGCREKTKSGRMELTAVIEAIKFSGKEKKIVVHSDSTYVLNCAIKKFSRKANLDLWKQFNDASKGKTIVWKKIKTKTGYNKVADELAKEEMRTLRQKR